MASYNNEELMCKNKKELINIILKQQDKIKDLELYEVQFFQNLSKSHNY